MDTSVGAITGATTTPAGSRYVFIGRVLTGSGKGDGVGVAI